MCDIYYFIISVLESQYYCSKMFYLSREIFNTRHTVQFASIMTRKIEMSGVEVMIIIAYAKSVY